MIEKLKGETKDKAKEALADIGYEIETLIEEDEEADTSR